MHVELYFELKGDARKIEYKLSFMLDLANSDTYKTFNVYVQMVTPEVYR